MKPVWSEVTALFGGRFDPPHEGHREAALGLLRRPGVARVIALPSSAPPHKPCAATAEQRLEMARLTFAGTPVTVDPREMPRSPAYSFDTIQEMRRQTEKLAFVVGADQFAQLPTWYRYPEILGLCHWLVLERKPEGAEMASETLHAWQADGHVREAGESGLWQFVKEGTYVLQVPTEAVALTSTAIREAIAHQGYPPQGSVTTQVWTYLKTHRVYGMNAQT